jgi:SAM-dependent methyltransferase
MDIDDAKEVFQLDWGAHAALRMLSVHEFDTVLDIGSGEGEHKRFFEYFGKNVFSVDIVKTADYVGDFNQIHFDRKFDAVWCSHVLEHQRNVGFFLDKIFDVLIENGILAIVVPVHPRERLVSGHITSWSVPLLCYNLILAGFDCSEAEILSTYELSIILKKRLAQHSELGKPSAHGADAGHEFDNLKSYFPFEAKQGKTIGGTGVINWDNFLLYSLPRPVLGNRDIEIKSKNIGLNPQLRPTVRCS